MLPSGQQLLLPAKASFIWASLLGALLLDMQPFGRQPWLPDFMALALVFWNIHQPRRIGMGTAFLFGLVMDVHQSALLGQHALTYTALSYFAIAIHRRLLWFTPQSQALHVLPLFAAAHATEIVLRLLTGGAFPGVLVLLAPLFEALLWPVVSVLLLAPQRRAPDPDENRPL